jgi:hypothetical protein
MLRGAMNRRLLLIGIAIGALLGACLPAQAAAERLDLARIEALAKGGAPGLALALFEQHAPASDDMKAWVPWERQRVAIYESQQDWDAIARRASELPSEAPDEFRRWMFRQAAQARLAANDPAGARQWLRRLIFGEQPVRDELAQWQRLVVRSYLAEGNLADAQTALLRYQHDYPARSDVWQVLHGEVLLRAGDNRGAYDVLAGAQSFEGRRLRLLAGLRSGALKPASVLRDAEVLARKLVAHPQDARETWAVAAEGAARANDTQARIRTLEQALRLPQQSGSLMATSADELWQAYDQLAERIGNSARLVIGQDCQWFRKARSLDPADPKAKRSGREKRDAIQARALFAFLTTQAQSTRVRAAAHEWLTASLFEEGAIQLVQSLYLSSVRYPEVNRMPTLVRYRLADKALAEYNVQLAGTLLKDMQAPPAGEDESLWQLRRARVLVYAGDDKAAVELLRGLVAERPALDLDFADRLLQVIFDLQAVGRHAEALPLLEAVYARVDNPRMRRELLFWQAESQAGLTHYQDAAELFLRSATFGDSSGGDPWGLTARFHAAETLAKAGLTQDARSVYNKLLAVTDDPRRRAVIERNIQQLWLIERKKSTP